ncbi:hypothetical protein E3Q22_01373 [Wallemia mellicola]|uniref:Uncharacterized protein n=2 Tax=Wallemia mellicola TaxID=1708541 RepID=A0A4T0M8Q3_9BASI|nr:hypothetical protein E3Q24_02779 [Wallemia mellicola]TIB79233.1 hypothetical protein E3Q23_00346 [Wallemia mellicola]TIB81149.1 hypothetical protein E3Q22_01373 [Wallemia mellicola]TIB87386.1 hypothetical protein E3Q21_01359 [Wallemia mellicola]TIB90317.1 hypothetical protein E3Q20_01346 [Wallemia mellicola]
MQFITTKLTFDENPDNLAPRIPWPRERNFYTSQIRKPTYTSREPLPVQLTLSKEQPDDRTTPPSSHKFGIGFKGQSAQRADAEELSRQKRDSLGSSFNMSAKVWFLNDQLMLVLDPLNRPKETKGKQQRRRSSILRALGRGGIPADAGVEQRRKASLVPLLDEPGQMDAQGVRRKSSIVEAIKRRPSVEDGEVNDEGRPQFNLDWQNENGGLSRSPQPRRWSTSDSDVSEYRPFPLYIHDKVLTSVAIPFSQIVSIHTTQLQRGVPNVTPPGSPKSRKASLAFETPEGGKSMEGPRKIAEKPATIEIQVKKGPNAPNLSNTADGTISIEFWDSLSGQIEADVILKYIQMVRMNSNNAPDDVRHAAQDLVHRESQGGQAQTA